MNFGVFFLRLITACLCGMAVGFERTWRLKEAGIRTHCIIASAACLVMIVSKYGFTDLLLASGEFYDGVRGADPARVAAQVISGISFLGAGVIFRNGNSVKGLTTAAGIWATAAIGLAIGAGMYLPGLLVTAIIVIIQLLFHRFSIGNDAYSEKEVHITAEATPFFKQRFEEMVKEKQIQVLSLRMEREAGTDLMLYKVTVRTKSEFEPLEFAEKLTKLAEVRSVSV